MIYFKKAFTLFSCHTNESHSLWLKNIIIKIVTRMTRNPQNVYHRFLNVKFNQLQGVC